jgi:hypothetical protein
MLLLAGVSGCSGTIRKAAYPATWPSRITSSSSTGCLDISGTYKTSNDLPLLPFFAFGMTDEASLDWGNLIQVYKERLFADPHGTTVTIGFPDSEHMEVIVAMHGTTVAKQLLTRSYQSESAVVMFGQHKRSFRCEPDSVVINSSYIHDWDAYSLPYEEKKRHYRRMFSAVGPLGVSEGYFFFSKTINGSLVACVHLYGCYPCKSLDEYWQRWEPILSPTPK